MQAIVSLWQRQGGLDWDWSEPILRPRLSVWIRSEAPRATKTLGTDRIVRRHPFWFARLKFQRQRVRIQRTHSLNHQVGIASERLRRIDRIDVGVVRWIQRRMVGLGSFVR